MLFLARVLFWLSLSCCCSCCCRWQFQHKLSTQTAPEVQMKPPTFAQQNQARFSLLHKDSQTNGISQRDHAITRSRSDQRTRPRELAEGQSCRMQTPSAAGGGWGLGFVAVLA